MRGDLWDLLRNESRASTLAKNVLYEIYPFVCFIQGTMSKSDSARVVISRPSQHYSYYEVVYCTYLRETYVPSFDGEEYSVQKSRKDKPAVYTYVGQSTKSAAAIRTKKNSKKNSQGASPGFEPGACHRRARV